MRDRYFLSRVSRLGNGKISPATAAVALLLVALAVAGCPGQVPVAPTAEVVSPTASVPPSQAPSATPDMASPAPSPRATPAATSTAAPTVAPTPTGPPPAPTIEMWSLPVPPGKVGSGLLYLIMAREKEWLRGPADSELNRVLAAMDQRGGADVAIVFDHGLSEQEVSSLEKDFGLKFSRFEGKVQTLGPMYSVIVPWEQIIPLAHLPYIKNIETSAWPPTRPAK